MEPAEIAETLRVARAAERMRKLSSSDWPDLAVVLLLEGVDDLEVAELAGFDQQVSPWTVDPLVEALCTRYAVAAPSDSSEAVALLAGLLAADLRARPANVTGPMIRLLARLAPPDFDSALANKCFEAEEYLDCDCPGHVEPEWEDELQNLPGPHIPDRVMEELARPLRSALPLVQPPYGH